MLGSSIIQKAWAKISPYLDRSVHVEKEDTLLLVNGLRLMKKIDFDRNNHRDELQHIGKALSNTASFIENTAFKFDEDISKFTRPLKEVANAIIEHASTTFVSNPTVPIPRYSIEEAIDNIGHVQKLIPLLTAHAEKDILSGVPKHIISELVTGLAILAGKYGIEKIPVVLEINMPANTSVPSSDMQKNLG